MKQLRTTLAIISLTALAPHMALAAGPADGPPRPTCTYSDHTCTVSEPELAFTVNKVNGITPASMNDCKLLPPCGHRPPPPGDEGPHAVGPKPPAGMPPAGDENLPKAH